jgi:hypothetical protein
LFQSGVSGPAWQRLSLGGLTSMRKLPRFAVLLVALSALFGYLGWRWFVRDSYRAYFAEHSGVRFPLRVTDVVHFTKVEFACSSHFSVPAKSRQTFIDNNHFAKIVPATWAPIFHLEDLPEPWNRLPQSGTLYYLTGADQSSAWDAVFHLESGSLWASIYYPDYHGDLPPRASGRSPNPQGGADGSQPSRSQTNSTSPAAGSRRSP